ncbi:hypothetical protein BIW11_10482 [Tropilaelaps mercedesae]|uniref:Ig-like domain-containing protein n=1 Tax=Tropilaelaps mercedesae TaxID=418985 RepID=A0A1V9XFF9_9ACAR|nr:hypothetical protein BIW11_10482 [Tropilaelaps mercedesae]
MTAGASEGWYRHHVRNRELNTRWFCCCRRTPSSATGRLKPDRTPESRKRARRTEVAVRPARCLQDYSAARCRCAVPASRRAPNRESWKKKNKPLVETSKTNRCRGCDAVGTRCQMKLVPMGHFSRPTRHSHEVFPRRRCEKARHFIVVASAASGISRPGVLRPDPTPKSPNRPGGTPLPLVIRISVYWWLTWSSVWLGRNGGVSGVKIERLSIPSSVENGTADSVVLDCIYSYSQEDQQLVVKWFFNQDPKPIYQWIPDLNKRSYSSSSRFEGHINRQYAASQDWYTRYRALNILRPTTDMSGTYSCSVTSLQGQDTRAAAMIVYARPKKFDLSFLRPDDSEETQFRCQVEGIFPEPQVLMYRIEQMHIAGSEYLNIDNMTGQLNYSVHPVAETGLRGDSNELRESAGLSTQAQQRRAARDGYSTVLTTSLSNRHFRRSHSTARHLFFCVYSIPSTDIKQTRVLEFYPVLELTNMFILSQDMSPMIK